MEEILTVAALTSAIKIQLESRFPAVQVKGEISNLKEQGSGHLYFTLKDLEAQIPAVLFRGNARDVDRPLKNGDQIIVKGELSVYLPNGKYQLIVRKVSHIGVGELLVQLHALKARLEAQGWFRPERKKPLPRFPRTIGVVTSATGSVIQDILNILGRRFAGFHLILNPVKVQGEGAAEEIAKAIEQFNRYQLADLLIVGRGGGSLEDLWAFNEEKVATAIFNSTIPVISAVGHETDFTIADFVADVRAPTPSAAAEIATQEMAQQLQFLTQSKNRLKGTLTTQLLHHRKQLDSLKRHPLLSAPLSLLEPHFQRVDDLKSDIALCLKRSLQEKQLKLLALEKQAAALKPGARIDTLKQKLATLSQALTSSLLHQLSARKKMFDATSLRKQCDSRLSQEITQKKQKLFQLASHLKGIDPKNLLTKGYCILFQEKIDSVILSTSELKELDRVRLKLHDGEALLRVCR